MLSKISVLILGIIEEKASNPYEITKLLDYIHIKDWFPVATSSVYATVKALQQKGYISGESRKDGNMPEKTIYSITEKGKNELHDSIINYLGSTELDMVSFNISSIMMCHLDKEEVLKILLKRLDKLEAFLKGLSAQLRYLDTNDSVPASGLIPVRHNLYLIEAEIKTTQELISEVQTDNDWNHYLAREIEVKEGAENGKKKSAGNRPGYSR